MSSNIAISSPFIKAFYANTPGTSTRAAGNPVFGIAYDTAIPVPMRRIYLLIQNKGSTDIDITFQSGGATIKLIQNQSISLDNYNGPFSLSSYTNAAIVESFI